MIYFIEKLRKKTKISCSNIPFSKRARVNAPTTTATIGLSRFSQD
jgi:hypothetical protein